MASETRQTKAPQRMRKPRRWHVAILCYSRAPHWFPAQVARAAQEFLNDAGCLVRIVGRSGPGRQRGAAFLRRLHQEGIDGLIDIGHNWSDGLRRIRWPKGLAFVAAGEKMHLGKDAVLVDERMVARLTLEHLAGLGHRRCGYFVVLSGGHVTIRMAAFEQEARRLNMWDPSLVLDLRGSLRDLHDREPELSRLPQVTRFFRHRPKPLAMFTHNDFAGAELLEWLLERGYAVPQDVAVAGVDNDPLYALANVGLTTVDIHPGQMGTESARLLLDRLAGRHRKVRRVTLKPTLVVRASTLSRELAADWLRAALDMLHEQYDQRRLVARVAERAGYRPETISRQFRRVMGSTFLEYRNEVRLEQASRLMRGNPQLKIAAVARAVGFSTPSRFAALFRRRFGVSPRDYQYRASGQA